MSLAWFLSVCQIGGFFGSQGPSRKRSARGGPEFQDSQPDEAGRSIGQVSEEPLEWDPTRVTAQAASAQALAANGGISRTVVLKIAVDADTGIYYDFDGADATVDGKLLEPGETDSFTTAQAVEIARAGATDVTVYILEGTVP